MDVIKIEIPSLKENIRIIESFIDNAKDRFSLNDDMYGNIMIAVTESVNNAIKHGNSGNPKKNVKLSMGLNDQTLKVEVEDEGPGFDYENLPDPTAPENIDKPSGRGIFLMKQLSDEVHFKNNGTLVELYFFMD